MARTPFCSKVLFPVSFSSCVIQSEAKNPGSLRIQHAGSRAVQDSALVLGGRAMLYGMRNRGILILGLVAGDGADVSTLVIDVHLAGGRIGE